MKTKNIIRNGIIIFTVFVLALSMVQAGHSTNDANRYDDQNPKYHASNSYHKSHKVFNNNMDYYRRTHVPSRHYGYKNAYRRGYNHGFSDGFKVGHRYGFNDGYDYRSHLDGKHRHTKRYSYSSYGKHSYSSYSHNSHFRSSHTPRHYRY